MHAVVYKCFKTISITKSKPFYFRRAGHKMLCNLLVSSCQHQRLYQGVHQEEGLPHRHSLSTRYFTKMLLLYMYIVLSKTTLYNQTEHASLYDKKLKNGILVCDCRAFHTLLSLFCCCVSVQLWMQRCYKT